MRVCIIYNLCMFRFSPEGISLFFFIITILSVCVCLFVCLSVCLLFPTVTLFLSVYIAAHTHIFFLLSRFHSSLPFFAFASVSDPR